MHASADPASSVAPHLTPNVPRSAGRGLTARLALRRYGPISAGIVAICWVISFAWWILLPSGETHTITIPAGTAARVAQGEVISLLPTRLEIRQGDTLILKNRDDQVHRIGTASVGPGETTTVEVTKALLGSASLLCSFHPSGSISVAPIARPGIEATIIPTVLAAVPLVVAMVLAMYVGRRLDASA